MENGSLYNKDYNVVVFDHDHDHQKRTTAVVVTGSSAVMRGSYKRSHQGLLVIGNEGSTKRRRSMN